MRPRIMNMPIPHQAWWLNWEQIANWKYKYQVVGWCWITNLEDQADINSKMTIWPFDRIKGFVGVKWTSCHSSWRTIVCTKEFHWCVSSSSIPSMHGFHSAPCLCCGRDISAVFVCRGRCARWTSFDPPEFTNILIGSNLVYLRCRLSSFQDQQLWCEKDRTTRNSRLSIWRKDLAELWYCQSGETIQSVSCSKFVSSLHVRFYANAGCGLGSHAILCCMA